MNRKVQSQVDEAIRLRSEIASHQNSYIGLLACKQKADDAARDAVKLLDDAENEVRVRAEMMEDSRLPKAKTSKGYEVAMKSIIAGAHADELRSEVEERDQARAEAEDLAVKVEAARVSLAACKAQAGLQVAVLNALAGA